MFKQITTAAAALAFAGLTQAGTIQFDFNSLDASISSGVAADFGTALFSGTLSLDDNANTLLEDILVDSTPLNVGPIVPADFDLDIDMSGTDVTGGTLSFSDGIETYTASVLAGGTVTFGPGSTFFVTNLILGPAGPIDIFGVKLDLDTDGNTFTFDGIPTTIRDGESVADVDVFVNGKVVPTPTAAAAGFAALGLLVARRRKA
ncbi:MAG: hypothetical protein AAGB29_09170 [Planctomycetota bacterium]